MIGDFLVEIRVKEGEAVVRRVSVKTRRQEELDTATGAGRGAKEEKAMGVPKP